MTRQRRTPEHRTRLVARVSLAMVAAILAGCSGGASSRGAETVQDYGLGRVATADEAATWRTEIGPDGAGLPPGSGSVAAGAAVYKAKCATCHGANGEGVAPAYPALVGRDPKAENFVFATDPKLVHTIGNYWPYATTVFDYVRRAMPHAQPGSLTNDEVYAVTAWLLAANQVIPMNTTLDAKTLRAVRMPYVDRFVRDDRRGGHEVR
jgi:cytochrome c